MPTFPPSVSEHWNLINRVLVPVVSVPVNKDAGRLFGLSPSEVISDPDFPGLLADPFDRTTGLGDLTYIGVLSPKEPIKTESTGGLLV